MTPSRRRRFSQQCNISRAPVTGQSGVISVATNLPCTPPAPASRDTRALPNMATIVALFEIQTEATAVIEDNDSLTLNNRTFSILRAQRWQASRRTPDFYSLVLEEQAQ